jgi:hypothetical protein
MVIRETIHHGDYRNVRTVDVPAPRYHSAPLTFSGLVSVLSTSPYNAGWPLQKYADNGYVAQLFVNLLTKGYGEFGWASYKVVEK